MPELALAWAKNSRHGQRLPPPRTRPRSRRPRYVAPVSSSAFSCRSSTNLRDDVDQRGLAALDRCNGACQRGTQIVRIGNRTLRVHAHALSELGIIHVGIGERAPDATSIDPAITTVAQALHVPGLHVVRPVC